MRIAWTNNKVATYIIALVVIVGIAAGGTYIVRRTSANSITEAPSKALTVQSTRNGDTAKYTFLLSNEPCQGYSQSNSCEEKAFILILLDNVPKTFEYTGNVSCAVPGRCGVVQQTAGKVVMCVFLPLSQRKTGYGQSLITIELRDVNRTPQDISYHESLWDELSYIYGSNDSENPNRPVDETCASNLTFFLNFPGDFYNRPATFSRSPYGSESGGSGGSGSGDGIGSGGTGSGTNGRGEGGSGGGSSATTQSNASNSVPQSSSQGNDDVNQSISPSPFYDGKQYESGSEADDGAGGPLVSSIRTLSKVTLYIGIPAAIVVIGGVAFIARRQIRRRPALNKRKK